MEKRSARQVLAENLSRLMEGSEILRTQKQVGSKAGVGQTTVGLMLDPNKNSPTLDTIEKVAQVFGREAWQLLLNEETLGGDYDILFRPQRVVAQVPAPLRSRPSSPRKKSM